MMRARAKVAVFLVVLAVFAWPAYVTVVSVISQLEVVPGSFLQTVGDLADARGQLLSKLPKSPPSIGNGWTFTSTPVPVAAASQASRTTADPPTDGTQETSQAPRSTPVPSDSPYPVMLELINKVRTEAGLPEVELGVNRAAQIHADNSLGNCISSHWGVDGLKPYMRYSLAGGYQSNSENGHGSDYCIGASDGYRPLSSLPSQALQAMQGWLDSPEHRKNILNPIHKRVNIGMAWDRYNFVAFQHFEGDYVEFNALPRIEGGELTFEGRVLNGAKFGEGRFFSVVVDYDPPPQQLTRGQVSRTYCYVSGRPVVFLRKPPPFGIFYLDSEIDTEQEICPDPYDVPRNASEPTSHDEANQFWQEAYSLSQALSGVPVSVPVKAVSRWQVSEGEFSVGADLSDILNTNGPGVYTVILWGLLDGYPEVLSQYSIFHGIPQPVSYGSQ